MNAMAQLDRDMVAQGLTQEELLIRVPHLEHGGIRTRESVCLIVYATEFS
jgi:hypothetical protein